MSSRTDGGRAVVPIQMPVTLTVPTTKIKSVGFLPRSSATSMTFPTSLVAIGRDVQHPTDNIAHKNNVDQWVLATFYP
jgi:hypothetical protein